MSSTTTPLTTTTTATKPETTTQTKTSVIIIGSGCFGVSTALWMLSSGRYIVTILDKASTLPAVDGASNDINKIVRAGDYRDKTLAAMNIEGVAMWELPEWEGTFHRSGCISCTSQPEGTYQPYDEIAETLHACQIGAMDISGSNFFSATRVQSPPSTHFNGVFNPRGGWVEAGRAMEVAIKRVGRMGGIVKTGWEVEGFVEKDGMIKGVRSQNGEMVEGDLVVVATGAWTAHLLGKALGETEEEHHGMQATGHGIATIQLTDEEAKQYVDMPVIMNIDNEFYILPPTSSNVLKFALHGSGITNIKPAGSGTVSASIPHTVLTPGGEDGMIPKWEISRLRTELAKLYPELANRPFKYTKMCWYMDTPTGDWLIDYHPKLKNLVIASGDSGHAFKFLPIIGRGILERIEGRLNPILQEKWRYESATAATLNKAKKGADFRLVGPKPLVLEDLAKPEDLL